VKVTLLLPAVVLLAIVCFTGFGQTVPCICPTHGKTCADITGDFGPRKHPVLNIVKEHGGVDFDVPVGTPVVATARGKVALAGPKDGYGLEVVVAHGRGYRTVYAHLSRVAVAQGASVKKGEVIAYSGKSGLVSTPHLHYEVMKDGKNVDPKKYIGAASHQ
jgi:murein DD-endopeptidase MepM/ murein hydrolase activator NlpD